MENKNENKIVDDICYESSDEEPKKKNRGRPRKEEHKHSKDKDEASKYQKEYYAKNKEKLLSEMVEKIKCPICNNTVSKCNLLTHQQSKKCTEQKYEKNSEQINLLVVKIFKLNKKQAKNLIKDPLIEADLVKTYNEMRSLLK